MCVWTSELVLHTAFAGQDHLFQHFHNFSNQKEGKVVVSTVVSGILFGCFLQLSVLAIIVAFFYDVVRKRSKRIPDTTVETTKIGNGEPTIFMFCKVTHFILPTNQSLQFIFSNVYQPI